MKKSLIFQLSAFTVVAVILILIGVDNKFNENNLDNSNLNEKRIKADKVMIYYFHTNTRCSSCITLEEFLDETINQYFLKEIENGLVEYNIINIDKPENKEIANKYKATGSSLFLNIIYNNKDHISQDSNVWRYLSNKEQFKTYLSNKIKKYLE